MDVAGVVGMRLDGNAKARTEEGADLGAGFLEAPAASPAFAERAVQPCVAPASVSTRAQDRIPGRSGCAHRWQRLIRHMDGTGRRPVAGLRTAHDKLGTVAAK